MVRIRCSCRLHRHNISDVCCRPSSPVVSTVRHHSSPLVAVAGSTYIGNLRCPFTSATTSHISPDNGSSFAEPDMVNDHVRLVFRAAGTLAWFGQQIVVIRATRCRCAADNGLPERVKTGDQSNRVYVPQEPRSVPGAHSHRRRGDMQVRWPHWPTVRDHRQHHGEHHPPNCTRVFVLIVMFHPLFGFWQTVPI